MKLAIFFSILLSAAAHAQGAEYQCAAKANPQWGFDQGFTILVKPVAVGGKIFLSTGGRQKMIGTISELGELHRNIESQRPAFDASLGLIGAEDTSGLAENELNKITSIKVIRAQIPGGDEALVYRLMNGSGQIGGTILISGQGTACQ